MAPRGLKMIKRKFLGQATRKCKGGGCRKQENRKQGFLLFVFDF